MIFGKVHPALAPRTRWASGRWASALARPRCWYRRSCERVFARLAARPCQAVARLDERKVERRGRDPARRIASSPPVGLSVAVRPSVSTRAMRWSKSEMLWRVDETRHAPPDLARAPALGKAKSIVRPPRDVVVTFGNVFVECAECPGPRRARPIHETPIRSRRHAPDLEVGRDTGRSRPIPSPNVMDPVAEVGGRYRPDASRRRVRAPQRTHVFAVEPVKCCSGTGTERSAPLIHTHDSRSCQSHSLAAGGIEDGAVGTRRG